MNKKLTITAIAVLISFAAIINLHAQNLVNDPGFESATSCTDNFNITPGWDDAGGGGSGDTCATPDIFTPCGAAITAIFGSHTPHGGNNYAGAYLYVAENFGCTPLPSANSREYIQGSLSQPMVAGQKYCVSFWVALSSNSPWAFAKMGVYFSNTHVVHNYCPGTGTGGTLLPFTPQLTWCGTTLKDTATWTQLKWSYTATGGEQYLIVGNFNNDANTGPVCANSGAFFPMMYYFYDDFYIASGCCPDSVEFSGLTSTGCGGVSNGATAGVAASTCGAGAYSYNWSNGTGGQTISNVSGGVYTVTVSTPSGCSATGSVNLGQDISISASSTSTGCGGSTGTATSSIISGTGPFTYAWSNGGTTSSISGLAAGTYTLTVSNSTGCSTTGSTTVGSSGSLSLSPSSAGTTCGGSNGSASVSATGGTGYTYAWSNGATSSAISSLPAGNYTVTVSATGGCSATSSASVAASPALVISPTGVSSTCGNNNGSASVSITTGTGPYTYAWSNGSTTATVTNLTPGSYHVTVSGAGACTATASASVDTSTAISLATIGGRAGCTSSGTSNVNVTEGNGPFTYLWSNGATTAFITSLSAGNYTVTVTGAANCTASATSTVITTGGGVTLSSTNTPSGCTDSTGSATVTTTSGTAPFTYAWSNGATSSTVQNLAAGSYTVTVTGSSGCTATATISVIASGTLSVTATSTNASCGSSNGTALANVSGNGTYSYIWSNSATTSSISNLAAGTYTVTAQEGASCSGTASVVINPSGGTINIQAQPAAVCQGDTSQICAPAGYSIYHWNIGASTPCVSVTQPGSYYLTVTDNSNCTATSNQVTLTVNTPDSVSFTQHGDSLIATNASSYQWYFNGTAIAGATSQTYIPTQDGSYYVEATDVNGCHAKSRTQVVKGILGINQVNDVSSISVYPNPLAGGSWHLDVTSDWIGSSYEIYDAAGRLIYRNEIRSTQSELELNIAQGIYLMRINSAQKNYSIKLIKL